MLKLHFAFLFICCFFVTITKAQLPASVQQEVAKAQHDTSKLRILKDYCIEFGKDDSVLYYGVVAALEIIEKNKSAPPPLQDVILGYKSDMLNFKGRFLFFTVGDGAGGASLINEAEVIARKLSDKSHISAVYGSLQDMSLIAGNLEQLKLLLDTSLALQLKINDTFNLVTTYTNLGNYHTGLGNADSTIYYYNKAYLLAQELGDAYSEGTLLSAIGSAYVHKGTLQEALPFFYKSVKRMAAAGKENEAFSALQGIGNVFSQMGEYHKAIAYFDSAIVLAAAKPEYISLSNLYFYKGNCYIKLGKPDSAIKYLTRCTEVAKNVNYLDVEIASLIKTGTVYLTKRDTATALTYFRLSLSENKEARMPENLQESYVYLGLILLSQHKVDSAFYYAKLAEETVKGLQFNSAKKQVQFLLSRVYEAKGDYKNALDAYKNFIVYRDSVDNKLVFRTALEKQFEYETEKKELLAKAEQEKKDIEIKAQKNRLTISIISFLIILALGGTIFYINRKRKETLYQRNLAESEMKALRAQMNPHFMFNSLNAIQQMVLNNENDNAFKYLDTYSKLTRKILENSEKKWIPLHDEIKFLELYLQIESLRFQNAFHYEIKTGSNVSVHEDKVPAMIIQPLVENAIKHGLLNKEGDKSLLISFNRPSAHGLLEVIVEDNGIGREEAYRFKRDDGHQSMSLDITENRLKLVDEKGASRIEIEDVKDDERSAVKGTRVRILITQSH